MENDILTIRPRAGLKCPLATVRSAVAYYKVEDGPVVLLQAECRKSCLVCGTDRDWRIASSKRCDAIMVIAKCAFKPSRAARTEYGAAVDG